RDPIFGILQALREVAFSCRPRRGHEPSVTAMLRPCPPPGHQRTLNSTTPPSTVMVPLGSGPRSAVQRAGVIWSGDVEGGPTNPQSGSAWNVSGDVVTAARASVGRGMVTWTVPWVWMSSELPPGARLPSNVTLDCKPVIVVAPATVTPCISISLYGWS